MLKPVPQLSEDATTGLPTDPWNGPIGPQLPTLEQLRDFAGLSVWTWHVGDNRIFHSIGSTTRSTVEQGSRLEDLLARIDPDDRRRAGRRLRAGAKLGRSGSFRVRTKDGAYGVRVLNATFFPLDQQVPAKRLQIIVQDVTAAAQSEQALRESEDHYRTAVALNPEIPWLADADGKIIEVGPRWTEIVGYSPAETMGSGWAYALHPEDVPATMERWRHSLATGAPVDVEYRIRDRSGRYIWMRARAACRRDRDGNIIRWYGTLEDIDERKRVVVALRDSEEFSRSILESGVVATEVLDIEGRLIFINGPGIEMMEVDDFDAIRGRPFESFWPDASASIVKRAIEQAILGRMSRQTLYGPTAKGSPRWWDLTISPVRDGQGQVSRLLAISLDVTEARRSEAEASAAARRLANVLESTMDNVISVGADWRITYLNQRAMRAFERGEARVGRDLRELFQTDESQAFLDRYREAMEQQSSIAFEEFLPSTEAWLEVQVYGSSVGLIIFFRDVTERRLAQERVVHMARHDPLTGLSNRLHFRERFANSVHNGPAEHQLAVLAIDLDDFKLVNDTMGHPAGDAVLTEVARRLLACSGSGSAVARLGGDEFAVMVQITEPEEAATLAQAILNAIVQPYEFEDKLVNIGASIGIAVTPRDGDDAEAVLQNADVALYRVKAEQGRGFRFFEPTMDRALRERREMKRELMLALQRNELSVVYQPQIAITDNRLTGFEALVRWTSATHGPVSPAVFIPLAEESNLIADIGLYVMEAAAREAMNWPEHIRVAVNLSPIQFRSHTLAGDIAEVLARTGLDPERLEVEITESVLLDENDVAIETLRDLHETGVTVALDDFGTGYSSLHYLQLYPFDKIKIDRSFVADLPGSNRSAAIVRAIIGLGRSFGMRVTAEGIESWEQLLLLAGEGCDGAQGYLFSRPLPAADARELAYRHTMIPGQKPAALATIARLGHG